MCLFIYFEYNRVFFSIFSSGIHIPFSSPAVESLHYSYVRSFFSINVVLLLNRIYKFSFNIISSSSIFITFNFGLIFFGSTISKSLLSFSLTEHFQLLHLTLTLTTKYYTSFAFS